MDEYINRDDLLKAAWDKPTLSLSVYDIGNIKPVDVAPVRHGRWMNANSRPKTYWRRCTACGGLAYFCGIGCSYKYCPNCGCRMDGGDDE